MGEMAILNVGEGDLKLSFDPANPMEQIQAGKTVTDMLRRGYALFVEVGQTDEGQPKYARVYQFDEEKREYIIAGDGVDNTPSEEEPPMYDGDEGGTPEPKRKRGRPTTRVKAEDAKGVGVARTAGG